MVEMKLKQRGGEKNEKVIWHVAGGRVFTDKQFTGGR
jgi:hypothetical protein